MDINKHKIYAADMPMGFDIALANNQRAKAYFFALAEPEQRRIIDNTHSISCKEQMQSYVDALGER